MACFPPRRQGALQVERATQFPLRGISPSLSRQTHLFTVPTLTFKSLYVLVFIAHSRRRLLHVNVAA
jgi:hypothetical protein